jgi:hypothetical protein
VIAEAPTADAARQLCRETGVVVQR